MKRDQVHQNHEIIQDDLVFVMSILFMLVQLYFYMNRVEC